MKNTAHILFEKHLRELGLTFFPEFRFHPERKWRFDYILTDKSGACPLVGAVAIEIEGAIYSQGRHTRGAGYQKDLDKYNHATALGYRVFRFSTTDVLRGRAKEFLKHWLCNPLKGNEHEENSPSCDPLRFAAQSRYAKRRNATD